MSDYSQVKNFWPSEGTPGGKSPRGQKATCHITTEFLFAIHEESLRTSKKRQTPIFKKTMGKRHEQFTKEDTRVADKRCSASLAIRGCKRNHVGRPAQQNGCGLKVLPYQVPARLLSEGRPTGDRNPRHRSDRRFSGSPKERMVRDLRLQA